MPFAAVNGIDLYYETHGDGPATVVLAHGRGGGHLAWWQQVPALSKRYRVVTFDHRGFGLSKDKNGLFRRAFADDLASLLHKLDVRSAYLVGQSMGGWTVLSYAVAHPERVAGLVMADTSGGLADPRVLAEYKRNGEPPGDPAERALGPLFRKRDPEGVFLYRQIGGLNPPVREPLMDLLLSKDGPKAREVKALKCRTLFIVGQHDPMVTPKIVKMCARAFPRSTTKVVPGAGHSVYYEQPKLFNKLLIDFIEQTRKKK
jgi:3-oxoadipate enol-lactonase